MTESKFKVGDRVYAPFRGYGTVIKANDDYAVYPVVVKWDKGNTHFTEDISTFTADGRLSVYINDDYTYTITDEEHILNKEEKDSKSDKEVKAMTDNKVKEKVILHIFDRVHSPYYGYGTVIGLSNLNTGTEPIILFDLKNSSLHSGDIYEKYCNESNFSVAADVRRNRCLLVHVYEASTNEDSLNKDEVRLVPFDSLEYRQHPIRVSFDGGRDSTERHSAVVVAIKRTGVTILRTGDYTFAGDSIILAFDKIEGTDTSLPLHSGEGLSAYCDNILRTLWPEKDIYYWAHANQLSFHEELMGTVPSFDIKEEKDNNNNKEDEENADNKVKVEYSPINPSHYRVDGIPEAIDIMEHLMTQEQFKGFLWGNIIKYAYRYGRKGDEHDTAGKIEWYANRLKEACGEKGES
jgi:hypothetical protein